MLLVLMLVGCMTEVVALTPTSVPTPTPISTPTLIPTPVVEVSVSTSDLADQKLDLIEEGLEKLARLEGYIEFYCHRKRGLPDDEIVRMHYCWQSNKDDLAGSIFTTYLVDKTSVVVTRFMQDLGDGSILITNCFQDEQCEQLRVDEGEGIVFIMEPFLIWQEYGGALVR